MSQEPLPQADLVLPWHDSLWRQIAAARRGGRMAHGLLICGPPAVGKRRFAERLARAVLCHAPADSGDACGRCDGCRQYAAGAHPDVSTLTPEEPGKVIRVDQLRAFTDRLHLTPQYQSGRLGWIDPAEQLNIASANSLLKTLEEPPEGTHLILVTSQADRLLPTIRSRCRILRVPPAPVDAARQWLAEQGVDAGGTDANALRMPLRLPGRLDETSKEMEQDWCRDLTRLLSGHADAVTLAERWAEQPPDLLIDWLYRTTCALIEFRLTGRGVHDKALADCAAGMRPAVLAHLCSWTARAAYLGKTNTSWQLVLESVLLEGLEPRRHV